MRRRRLFKQILFYTASSFIVVMMLSLLMLLSTFSSYREGLQLYDALAQHLSVRAEAEPEPFPLPLAHPEPEPEPEYPEEEPVETFTLPDHIVLPEVDFDGLRAINPNVVGWIILEGTPINYPVVQGDDNYHYLDHLFNGTRNPSGAIFVDSYNLPDFVDDNTVIYGHHMRDGSMFAALERYRSQAFFDENPWVFLLTPEGNYVIKLFAGYVVDVEASSWRLEFSDDAEMQYWIDERRSRSDFISDVEVGPSDRLVTLSTCSFVFHNARYVVVGRLMPIA